MRPEPEPLENIYEGTGPGRSFDARPFTIRHERGPGTGSRRLLVLDHDRGEFTRDEDLNPHIPSHPLIGAYYWVPIPPLRSLNWRVLTCHDLGFDEDHSHFELWPAVIPHLATIWDRDPKAMKRRLGRHCYGLPRGRVTRPEKTYLILHGDDSPIPEPDWTEAVVRAFRLHGRRVKPLLDEHEQTLPGDVRAEGPGSVLNGTRLEANVH
jgi:hypothetical protein